MAKKSPEEKSPVVLPERISVTSRNIVTEMKESFIDYAMSVITDRALPDVRDGRAPGFRAPPFPARGGNDRGGKLA